MDVQSFEIKELLLEARRLNSGRAIKLRQTLRFKGKKNALIARRKKSGISIRLKTGKDILRNRLKTLRAKANPLKRRKKQRRAFKLTDRGIRA